MDRRALLVTVGTAAFAGCLVDSETGEVDPDTEEHVREREKEYLESGILTRDDERLDGSLSPRVVSTESREEGEYVELETGYNVVRDSDDEPRQYGHGDVTASYLVDGDDVYRTGETEGDPKHGIELDC